MAKTAKSAEPTITRDLTPERTDCPHCGRPMTADYANRRTLHTLAGVTRLNLTIRRCHHAAVPGPQEAVPARRPKGSVALPRHEFGLDVIALIGRLRYAEHRSVPEIRTHLVGRRVTVSERTVTNLLDRYDELLAVALADDRRLKKVLADPGAGDPGHRRAPTGRRARGAVGRPRLPVRRDPAGQEPAVGPAAGPGRVADGGRRRPARCRSPGSCPTASTRSARRWPRCSPGCRTSCASSTTCGRRPGPIYEADRHAKKELKKKVRGVREDRAAVGGPDRPGGGGGPGVLLGGAERPDGRRAAAPGGVGAEAARPAGGDRRRAWAGPRQKGGSRPNSSG